MRCAWCNCRSGEANRRPLEPSRCRRLRRQPAMLRAQLRPRRLRSGTANLGPIRRSRLPRRHRAADARGGQRRHLVAVCRYARVAACGDRGGLPGRKGHTPKAPAARSRRRGHRIALALALAEGRKSRPADLLEEHVAKFGAKVPLGRPGQPDEIAPSYVFLASDASSYMTGQVLHPNGGEVSTSARRAVCTGFGLLRGAVGGDRHGAAFTFPRIDRLTLLGVPPTASRQAEHAFDSVRRRPPT